LESSLKTARLWRAVFRLQSREFTLFGRELSALKLILKIAAHLTHPPKNDTIAMCKLLQYRKEGCTIPLFPVLKQLAQGNIVYR